MKMISTVELPQVSLTIATGTQDFETGRWELQASGWTAEEARANMDYLIKSIEKLTLLYDPKVKGKYG